MLRKPSNWKKAQVSASRKNVRCFLNFAVSTVPHRGLRFKNVRGFKVHDHAQKTNSAFGRYTKLHRNATGLLRVDKKKYALKAQNGATEEDLSPLPAPDHYIDDVNLVPMDTLPPETDLSILGEERPRKRYASVSGYLPKKSRT